MHFMVMFVKKWLLLLLVTLLCMPVQAKEEPEELYAQSAVLMDAESGRVLFSKNGTDVKAMASTTKIMTCILALEHEVENQTVQFSKEAAKQPKVHLGAKEGESFYGKDLLYSLMLESHNDTAVAIAEAISGNVPAFANLMNEKAKELGCTDTHFITPNGLDASDQNGIHSTTAVDLAKIMSYCVLNSPKKQEFIEITQTPTYSFSNLEGTRAYSCTNHNAFLNMMSEAISGKTGYTADAGYCYVGAIESENRTFVVALLACGWPNNKSYKWKDMRKLAEYGMKHYQYREDIELPQTTPIKVENGIPISNQLFEEAYIRTTIIGNGYPQILLHQEEKIICHLVQKETLKAPVKKNQVVGEVLFELNDEVIASYPIVASEKVDKINFKWSFQKVAELFML